MSQTARRISIVFLTAIVMLTASAVDAKKRIAVLDFEFNAIQHWWEGDWDIGRGIADILVTKLVTDGHYSVIERKQIETILSEQDFSHSGRVDPATAAKIGKILGLDGIVVGSITQFGTEDKKTGGIGGVIGNRAGVLGGVGVKKTKAKVAINARLIDVNTAEILAVSEGVGQSKRSGLLLGGMGASSNRVGGGAFEMTSSNFRETILGEATESACDSVVHDLVEQYTKLPGTKLEISAKIADYDATKKEVTINVGTEAGVAAGQVFAVERVTREIKDPETGQVVRRVTEEVARFTISEVGKGYAVGKVTTGTDLQVGDLATLAE
jgi:curli biogenesis system outer membrane secretion channel CsgG